MSSKNVGRTEGEASVRRTEGEASASVMSVRRTEGEASVMSVRVALEPQVLFFDPAQLDRWRTGDRDYCSDAYCRGLPGTSGFGEYLVGAHFESQGYEWIHHDFDILGTNRAGKYPHSEAVLLKYLGEARLEAARGLYRTLEPFREERHVPVETPDLLVFRPDASEIRFAECKRTDTGDRINRRQAIGLTLLAAVLRCPVDFFLLAPCGSSPSLSPIEVGFPCLP